MKKRFIILIDFSTYSQNLLAYAYDWSKQINAELLCVHETFTLSSALTDNSSRNLISQNANSAALENLKELISSTLPAMTKVSYFVSETPLQLTLRRLLKEPFHNLIFVGLKGTGFLKKIFIGSEAIKIIENTENIVVAVPKDLSKFSHEKIYVAVAEKNPLNILELNYFFSFIDNSKTSITFFSLAKTNENTQKIEKQLKGLTQLFSEKLLTTYAIYQESRPFTDIKKVINNKIDEILIVQKGSRLLTDILFRKLLINELVYEGQTPLIVLP